MIVDTTPKEPVFTYTEPDGSGGYSTGTLKEETTKKVTVCWHKDKVTMSRGEALNG